MPDLHRRLPASHGLSGGRITPVEVPGVIEHPEYLPGRDYTDRPNVVGVLTAATVRPARLGRAPKSLLFTGHVDVVPAVGQGQHGWWDGTIEDGKLYGRGSNDMKGGIAAYIDGRPLHARAGLELVGDLILETVVDEEFGGANGTLAGRLPGYNADVAICPSRTTCSSAPPIAAASGFASPPPRGRAWDSVRPSLPDPSPPSVT